MDYLTEEQKRLVATMTGLQRETFLADAHQKHLRQKHSEELRQRSSHASTVSSIATTAPVHRTPKPAQPKRRVSYKEEDDDFIASESEPEDSDDDYVDSAIQRKKVEKRKKVAALKDIQKGRSKSSSSRLNAVRVEQLDTSDMFDEGGEEIGGSPLLESEEDYFEEKKEGRDKEVKEIEKPTPRATPRVVNTGFIDIEDVKKMYLPRDELILRLKFPNIDILARDLLVRLKTEADHILLPIIDLDVSERKVAVPADAETFTGRLDFPIESLSNQSVEKINKPEPAPKVTPSQPPGQPTGSIPKDTSPLPSKPKFDAEAEHFIERAKKADRLLTKFDAGELLSKFEAETSTFSDEIANKLLARSNRKKTQKELVLELIDSRSKVFIANDDDHMDSLVSLKKKVSDVEKRLAVTDIERLKLVEITMKNRQANRMALAHQQAVLRSKADPSMRVFTHSQGEFLSKKMDSEVEIFDENLVKEQVESKFSPEILNELEESQKKWLIDVMVSKEHSLYQKRMEPSRKLTVNSDCVPSLQLLKALPLSIYENDGVDTRTFDELSRPKYLTRNFDFEHDIIKTSVDRSRNAEKVYSLSEYLQLAQD
ncbi:hypothetical protein RCL1_007123 [Eukaryota sp. TZLM3-RCL]